jgi:exonuclease SbcC
LQNALKDIEQKLKDVNAWRDKINMEYEDISGKQNNIYPKLLKQKIELSRALKDEYTVKVLHKEILRLKKEHDKLVVTNKHLSINIEKKDKLKTELNNTLESILSRYRSLIIDKDMKKAINEAVKLTEKKNMLTEEIDANLLVLKDKEIIYLSINDRLLTLKRQYDISSNELMDKEDILDKLQRDDMESILLRIRDSVKKLREEPGGSYLLLEEECLKDVDIILRPVNILSEKNIKDFKHPDSTKKLYSISIDFKGLADILSNKKKLKEQLQNAVGIMRKSINEIGIELGMLTKDKSHAQERISEIKLKIESSNTELKRISDKLTEFKNILGFSDFINKKDELDKQEEEAYKLSIDAEGIRETISLINKELDSLKLKLSDLNVDIANIKTQGKEKKDNMETILSSIKQLNLDNNISEELNKVSVELNTLEKNFNRLRLELQNATDMKQNLEKDYSVIVGEIRALNPALKDKENRLYKEISQSEFASEDEVLEACLDKDMENKMALEVADFYDDKKRLAGLIASLEDKLQLIDRQSIVKDIDVLSTRLNILRGANDRHTRDLAVITERLRQAQADIVILKELLNKRDMEVGKKKLLDELSKIFYGNRFVEFVSKRQLIYISEQASERLGDISHNRYAIELDDNNDFIIRDNFNGGLRRSPKTLSGGETFVVSLCLALALSSSIQLKSKCGLDFFFLDEGFGTLDSVLLDVVMEALDSLRKQRIKIGLITHVEEIKARIQKKLIVTKADHGEYGSKVKLVL